MAKKLVNTNVKLGEGTILVDALKEHSNRNGGFLMGLYNGQLPPGDANLPSYWNTIYSGIWMSTGSQTNSKGSWGIVLVLKTQEIPSPASVITRILWFPQQGGGASRFWVGAYNDGQATMTWYQV